MPKGRRNKRKRFGKKMAASNADNRWEHYRRTLPPMQRQVPHDGGPVPNRRSGSGRHKKPKRERRFRIEGDDT